MDLTRIKGENKFLIESQAYEMSHLHRLDVARLMARLKPDWWDVKEALEELAGNTGWYLMDRAGAAAGWLIAHQQTACRTVEIDSLGYECAGELTIGPGLDPLLRACEDWGLYNGMANSRYIMSSQGLSVHNQEISDPALSLTRLKNCNRPDFDWFLSRGYKPCGILPQIFGYLFHGVILVKELKF